MVHNKQLKVNQGYDNKRINNENHSVSDGNIILFTYLDMNISTKYHQGLVLTLVV